MDQISDQLPIVASTSVNVEKSSDGYRLKWEHVAIGLLAGAAVISTGLLYSNWKSATLGKKVSGNVVDFLMHHGATVKEGKIVGGPVTIPMDTDEAVVNTVDAILRDITKKANIQQRQTQNPRNGDDADDVMGAATSRKSPRRNQRNRPLQNTENAEAGGQPKFPEPPISGKTGMPLADNDGEGGPGSNVNDVRGSGYPSDDAVGGGEDYSYEAPGPKPPANIP
jgi:hypothetical protein